MTILKSMPRRKDCDFVFTTTGRSGVSGFSKIKRRLDELMAVQTGEPVKPWRLHDLRRTGASDMQRLGIRLEVIEKILNHTSGSFAGIVGIYQRHSFLAEKRAALEAWARFVEQLIAEEPAAEIVYSAPSRAESHASA
jgi:integrase